ncbi:DUF4407 domain-containing protein [Actinoplanes oblitus]|uniref:DUF4407 domain-containing protein n=1 Tax=Actinoplanes oblitus TaxID=3040509 RepID=A0ABY8WJ63_9ACTN|nr:DUF4407 domain-containing protein [Actinoplanes oblitus]WIM96389.1 DUF4407 domain-containing protein [Actinoplanes oblitus]
MVADITVDLSRPRGTEPPAGRAAVPLREALYRRPEAPDTTTISLLARRLIGVREQILSWVPEERPRYTRLGLIVVNTALMAAISLWTALTRVVDVPWPLVIPVAVFWGLLVLTIDSWMVSSSHGALGAGRWFMFVPRLIMAVLLGCVIAEPLVLWIFHPAIHTDVEHHRQEVTGTERGRWTRCNPVDGTVTAGLAGCEQHQLALQGPAGTQGKVASLTAQRTELGKEYARLSAELTAKQELAQAECTGNKIAGGSTSQRRGNGPLCKQAWRVADDFEAQNDLPGRQRKIASLDQQIEALSLRLGDSRQTYAQAIEKGIDAKVEQFEGQFGKIDIIDEAQGLERLSERSGFVWSAQWLVRILLIVVDSLPVLAKMLSGCTSYDRLVNRQLRTGQSFHGLSLDYAEHQEKASIKTATDRVDTQSRLVREQHDEDLDAEIDRRAKRYADEMRD